MIVPVPFPYPYAGLATALVIFIFIWTGFVVGRARKQYDIQPPATEGPDGFNRAWRAHQNTFEALPQIIAALWLFAIAISDVWAAILTIIWAVGRILYVRGYCAAAEKRLPGFALSSLALLALLLGATGRIIFQLLA